MYATIPEDAEAKQPKNQAPGPVRRGYGLVVAVCVGVIIGTLGTIAFVGGPEAPSRAAMELDQDLVDDDRPAIPPRQDVTRNGIKMSNGNSAPAADTSRAARKRCAGIT